MSNSKDNNQPTDLTQPTEMTQHRWSEAYESRNVEDNPYLNKDRTVSIEGRARSVPRGQAVQPTRIRDYYSARMPTKSGAFRITSSPTTPVRLRATNLTRRPKR